MVYIAPHTNTYERTQDPYEAGNAPYIHVEKVEFNKTVNKTTNINIPAEDPTAAIIRAAGDFIHSIEDTVKNIVAFFWGERSINKNSPFGPIHSALKAMIPSIPD